MAPTRTRPRIPEGYGVSVAPDGMLEWEPVAEAIAEAEIYWLSTISPATGSHLVPLHACALDGTVYLSGDDDTRWALNLAADPRIQVGVHHAGLQIMVRGRATLETPDPETFAVLDASLQRKYEFGFDDPIAMWVVAPDSVLAFDPAQFATSPTRFTFGASS